MIKRAQGVYKTTKHFPRSMPGKRSSTGPKEKKKQNCLEDWGRLCLCISIKERWKGDRKKKIFRVGSRKSEPGAKDHSVLHP